MKKNCKWFLHFVVSSREIEREKCGFAQSMPYKKGKEVNDERIQKWVLRGSNWEWNRFFRKLNCCGFFSSIAAADIFARHFKLRAVKHKIGNSGRNSTILNAKFVKSWISVASREEFRKCFHAFDFFFVCGFALSNFIVLVLLSDADKLLLWIVDFFFSHLTKALVFRFPTINPIN